MLVGGRRGWEIGVVTDPGTSRPDQFDAALGAAMRMTLDVELVAATVAHLGARAGGPLSPAIAEAVEDLATLTLPQLDELQPSQVQALAGILTTIFRQAADLIDHPDRTPGWTFDDPVILQATGRASMSVADVLAEVANDLGDLAERMSAGGTFCDVGTGVGWLAIAAASHWQQARVVGIDIHAPALLLAERNVASSGVSDRIEIRRLDVRDLDVEFDASLDLVWLPGPFLPFDVVPSALAAASRSLCPGGWLAFGLFGGPPDPIGQRLADLRTLRAGGHPWSADAAVAAVGDAGFANVREVDRSWNAPVRLVVGQVPADGR